MGNRLVFNNPLSLPVQDTVLTKQVKTIIYTPANPDGKPVTAPSSIEDGLVILFASLAAAMVAIAINKGRKKSYVSTAQRSAELIRSDYRHLEQARPRSNQSDRSKVHEQPAVSDSQERLRTKRTERKTHGDVLGTARSRLPHDTAIGAWARRLRW